MYINFDYYLHIPKEKRDEVVQEFMETIYNWYEVEYHTSFKDKDVLKITFRDVVYPKGYDELIEKLDEIND